MSEPYDESDTAVAVTVRPARTDESDAVSSVLARAFAQDPILRWLLRGRIRGAHRRQKFFGLELEGNLKAHGRTWVAEVETPERGLELGGACLVLEPEHWMLPQATTTSEALQWLSVFHMRLPAAVKTQLFLNEHHLTEPHWYIRYAGVSPELQGQGVGTELLQPVLALCDAEWLPAYLEASSERNAALYERLGFVHLGELRIPNGPRIWPMRRPPTRRS